VGAIDDDILQWLRKDLHDYLDLPVKTMGALAIPEGSFLPNRNQYHSTAILKEILAEVPPGALKVLGLIDRDLCIPILTFVFGEAQLGGTVSLVSLARLRQDFYGLAPDPSLFRERLYKECLHELGHNFGLIHCHARECVMYLSNTVMDVDRKERTYCRDCDIAMLSKIERGRI
jgi:archaemetzincin